MHGASLDRSGGLLDGLGLDGSDNGRSGGRGGGRGSFCLDRGTTDVTGDDLSGNILFGESAHIFLVVVLGLQPEVELDDGDRVQAGQHQRDVGWNDLSSFGKLADFLSNGLSNGGDFSIDIGDFNLGGIRVGVGGSNGSVLDDDCGQGFGGAVLFEEFAHILIVIERGLKPEVELNDSDRVETSKHERNVGGNGGGSLGETSNLVGDVHSNLDAATDGGTSGEFHLLNSCDELLAGNFTSNNDSCNIFLEEPTQILLVVEFLLEPEIELDNSDGVEPGQHEGDISGSRSSLGEAGNFLGDLCSNFIDTGDQSLDGNGGGGLNDLDGGSDLTVCDLLKLGDINLVRGVVRHLLDATSGGNSHSDIIARLLPQSIASGLENFNFSRFAGPEENDPLVGLDELVSSDGSTKSVAHRTLQLVHINEKTVDLDVPGATTVDNDAAISGNLADIVGVEEQVVTIPGAEHVLGSLSVAHVVGGGRVGDDTNDAGSASSFRDNVHVVVEDNKVLATLGGIEVDELGNRLLRANEHLADTGESNLGAGIIASEGGLGEDLLGQLEVVNAEGLSTDDHPVEAIEGVLGTELHSDVVNEGTEDRGGEVGPEKLGAGLVFELSAEGSALIGDRNGLVQVEGGLVEHETTNLEERAKESLERRVRKRKCD